MVCEEKVEEGADQAARLRRGRSTAWVLLFRASKFLKRFAENS